MEEREEGEGSMEGTKPTGEMLGPYITSGEEPTSEGPPPMEEREEGEGSMEGPKPTGEGPPPMEEREEGEGSMEGTKPTGEGPPMEERQEDYSDGEMLGPYITSGE